MTDTNITGLDTRDLMAEYYDTLTTIAEYETQDRLSYDDNEAYYDWRVYREDLIVEIDRREQEAPQ